MHACMHACIHTYVHTYIPTYIHTYIHTYLHTVYTYTCTHDIVYVHIGTHVILYCGIVLCVLLLSTCRGPLLSAWTLVYLFGFVRCIPMNNTIKSSGLHTWFSERRGLYLNKTSTVEMGSRYSLVDATSNYTDF